MATFDTGLVISNTSEESGSCTITYTGENAPEDSQTTQAVAGGAQWISLSSTIAPGFQGYFTATCGFRDAHGFAYLSNGFGVGAATAGAGLSRGLHGGNFLRPSGRLRRPIVQRLLA